MGLFGFHIIGAFIVGIISGHIALSNIKRSGGRLGGRGIAIAGLFLNYLPVVVGVVIGIIFIVLIAIGAAASSTH